MHLFEYTRVLTTFTQILVCRTCIHTGRITLCSTLCACVALTSAINSNWFCIYLSLDTVGNLPRPLSPSLSLPFPFALSLSFSLSISLHLFLPVECDDLLLLSIFGTKLENCICSELTFCRCPLKAAARQAQRQPAAVSAE